MSKFHTTVSRRDFMKGLGLAGAGLGAAAATAPVFHDLDEVTASPRSIQKHPWFVKELEHEKPTVEIDWGVYGGGGRLDRTRQVSGRRYPLSATSSAVAKINATAAAARQKDADGWREQWMKNKFPTYKGETLRDDAVTNSINRLNYGSFLGELDNVRRNIGEPMEIDAPDVKWTGTPEENLRTMWTAARFFGAATIGVVEMTSVTKKLVNKCSSGGTPINFKDVPAATSSSSEIVVPNQNKYMLFFATLESHQARVAPAGTLSGYEHYSHVERKIHYFLGRLGYQHNNVSSYTQSNAWGTFAGVTEHSRACMIGTSYKYGNMFRGMHRILTDFPMAPTAPYDAGIARFCKDCVTCADSCPWEAMPTGDASWDHELPEEETLLNYTPGYKGWRLYNLKCIRCKNCHTACPFNSYNDAMIHGIVRATAATIPLLNGFMANMHTAFGYGTKNPVDFWERDDMSMGRFDADWVK